MLKKQRPPSREENLRAFRVVAYFLLFVAVAYIIVAWLVFGHF